MALLLLRNEAACLVPDMKTELVSSRVPPELSRSPLPRERFRPLAGLRPCCWGSATCRTRPASAGDINFASGNPFPLNRHRHGRIESTHPVLARQTATLRLHNAEFNSSR